MCTGNSCRSIIAEALINRYIESVDAYSCGVNPSGKVNENAKKVLQENGCWRDNYYSKNLDEVIDIGFDLVVTVCDHAKETCPTFPKNTKIVHLGFEDPDGKDYSIFETTFNKIKEKLLPKVQIKLFNDELVCWCKNIYKEPIINAIKDGATSLKEIKLKTTACTGDSCKVTNPKGVCCSKDINNLIKEFAKIENINSCNCTSC